MSHPGSESSSHAHLPPTTPTVLSPSSASCVPTDWNETRLTGLLYRALSDLARQGWVVPFDESSDVIRTFIGDLQHGLVPKWEPARGAFSTYAYNHFKWSVKARLQKDARFRQQCVDFNAVVDVRHRSPAETVEANELERIVTKAYDRLAPFTVVILKAYLEHPSERQVAEKFHTTRHEIRNRLADGFGTLLVGFPRPPYITAQDWEVLLCIYAKGLTISETALLLRRQVSDLQVLRSSLLSRLSQSAKL